MKLEVYVVYDSAADMYGNPQFTASLGLASRGFGDEVNRSDKENPLFSHSSDFSLFHLGSYDTSTARFSLLEVPVLMLRGSDVRIKS